MSSYHTLRYTPLLRWLNLAGIAVLWGIALLGWLAYTIEGVAVGRLAAGIMAGIGGVWLWTLAAAPYTVDFAADQLIVRRWLGAATLPYAEIEAVSLTYWRITLRTAHSALHLPKLFPNDDARLWDALETYVPVAQRARAQRLRGDLPIVLRGRRSTPLLTACMGLLLLGVGGGSAYYALTTPNPLDPSQQLVMPLVGGLMAVVGAFFLALVLRAYPYRTEFTADRLTQRFLLHTRVQPMTGLTAVQPGHTVHSVRGLQRRLYHLTFHHADGRTWQWVPHEFDFPVDYIDRVEAAFVAELAIRLRHAYGLPTVDGPRARPHPDA